MRRSALLSPHFDAGVDGADEKDIGEHHEDGDVQAQHKHRAVSEGREQAESGRRDHQRTPSSTSSRGTLPLYDSAKKERKLGDLSRWRNLLWENDDLDETDAAEDEEGAGHVAAKTVINLSRVLYKKQTKEN